MQILNGEQNTWIDDYKSNHISIHIHKLIQYLYRTFEMSDLRMQGDETFKFHE